MYVYFSILVSVNDECVLLRCCPCAVQGSRSGSVESGEKRNQKFVIVGDSESASNGLLQYTYTAHKRQNDKRYSLVDEDGWRPARPVTLLFAGEYDNEQRWNC